MAAVKVAKHFPTHVLMVTDDSRRSRLQESKFWEDVRLLCFDFHFYNACTITSDSLSSLT